MSSYGQGGYGAGVYGQDAYGRGTYGSGDYGEGLYGSGRRPQAGSLLDRNVGVDALVVTVNGTVVALDHTGPVIIRHGRSSPETQPDAATCSLTVKSDALPALPTLGDAVRIDLGDVVHDWLHDDDPSIDARFVGTITDLTVRPERDVTGAQLLTITAVSSRARTGRAIIGDAPWPAETDGARASRILTLAAASTPLTLGTSDPGLFTVRARDVDRRPALQLLEELAASTLGVLAETRAGALLWHDADHRTLDAAPAVTLDASSVLRASTTSTMRAGQLVNDLTVTYGDTDPQPSAHVTHAASIATNGLSAAALASQLEDAEDAETVARTIVGRRSRPAWSTPGVTVDLVRTVDVTTAAALLRLEFGDLLGLTGYPAAGPFSDAQLWVEGWTETYSRYAWRLELDVSAFELTVSPRRFDELDPALRWSDVPPALTWLDTRLGIQGA